MKSAISDKKIFYGLVALIVLTILLIIGISYIQRPQTTSSDAQFQEPLTQQITQDGEAAAPTSIPLIPDEETFVDNGPDQQQIDGNIPEETSGDSAIESQDTTPTPDSGTSDPGTVEIVDTGSLINESDSPTPTSDVTSEASSASTSEDVTSTETPMPTETLLASGNDTSSSGGSALDDPEPTTSIGGGTSGTEISYSTSTPVPTASDQLPVAGAAHVTILLLGASLMLVVLGFILT